MCTSDVNELFDQESEKRRKRPSRPGVPSGVPFLLSLQGVEDFNRIDVNGQPEESREGRSRRLLEGVLEGRLSALLEQCRNPDLEEADLRLVLEGLLCLSTSVYSVVAVIEGRRRARDRYSARSRAAITRAGGIGQRG